MLAIATWLSWLIAITLFLVIALLGLVFLRGIASSRPKETIEPEDVAELDVFFVCTECGTEFQVTRLGEIQVPRHCGEPMAVVRRPRVNPAST
ncbi:MAG: hypothetical protein ACRDHO_12850 [Actinomycetota bacterium]